MISLNKYKPVLGSNVKRGDGDVNIVKFLHVIAYFIEGNPIFAVSKDLTFIRTKYISDLTNFFVVNDTFFVRKFFTSIFQVPNESVQKRKRK